MKGFWNGEPVKIKGVEYTVTQEPQTTLHWQNAVVGTRRQGLEITWKDEKWIIDNQHGHGHLKVTEGRGSFQYGHASVSNPKDLEYIEDDYIFKTIDNFQAKLQIKSFDFWAIKHYPNEFKRLKALRDSITKKPKW